MPILFHQFPDLRKRRSFGQLNKDIDDILCPDPVDCRTPDMTDACSVREKRKKALPFLGIPYFPLRIRLYKEDRKKLP